MKVTSSTINQTYDYYVWAFRTAVKYQHVVMQLNFV
jgi:hypothetical protein